MEYNRSYCGKSTEMIQKLASAIYVKDGLPSVVCLENAIILPRKTKRPNGKEKIPYQGLGGVVDANGNFVKESVIYDLDDTLNQKQKIAFGGAYLVNDVEKSDKAAIYMGLAHSHWGHFLIDVVQRCWCLFKPPLTHGYTRYSSDNIALREDYIFAFAGFGDNSNEFKGNNQEFFRLLGMDSDRIVFINKATQFKQMIVPDVAIYPGRYICTVYKELFDIVCRNAMYEAKNINKVDKIYFSRTNLKELKEIGENRVELVMKKCGYTVLYPEELTLVEQIYHWQNADEIACISGTIPHMCVFASNKLSLYVFNKMCRIVGYQFTMDRVWGKTPIYILACKEPFKRYPLTVSRGPFWIGITHEIQKFVHDIFDVLIEDEPSYFIWVHYIALCVLAEIKYQLRGLGAFLKKIGIF